jgi:hypothetical protein
MLLITWCNVFFGWFWLLNYISQVLREKIKPHFLRRVKSDIFLDSDAKKNELIVWLKLTAFQVWLLCHCCKNLIEILLINVWLMTFFWAQRKLYEAFLKRGLVHLAIEPKGSPLVAITVRSPYKKNIYTVHLPLHTCFLLLLRLTPTFLCGFPLCGVGYAHSLFFKN